MITKKFRERLEEQKVVLAKRLKNEPVDEGQQPRRLRKLRRFGPKLHRKLLFALAGQQIKDVTSAIERLDEGVFGVCVACGEKIDPKRLEVMPTTTFCWDCQHERS